MKKRLQKFIALAAAFLVGGSFLSWLYLTHGELIDYAYDGRELALLPGFCHECWPHWAFISAWN